MDIKRIDTYEDSRFSKEVLLQHGAFLMDGLPYEVEIISEEEDFWGWEIDEEYIADVTAGFKDPAFQDSLSLLAYMDGKEVGRIDAALIHRHFDGSASSKATVIRALHKVL